MGRNLIIKKSWHKHNDKIAMTYEQYKYIVELINEDNISGWEFKSVTNACRSLTKTNASNIIDALKSGEKVEII